MIDSYTNFFIWLVSIGICLWAASFLIPYKGFTLKRYKGLALGCLLQPIFCIVILLILIFAGLYYMGSDVEEHRKAAMMSFCKLENDSTENKTFYYVKTNDECFIENGVGKDDQLIFGYDYDNKIDLADVFYNDSSSICVDDDIIVRFDLKNRKVKVTDYEDSLEVVSVDWDKVNAYFNQRKAK